MAFTIATDSPETRRLLQMNKLAPMTTPSAPRIKEEESAKSKFLNALGNEGLGVASKEAVGLAKEYGAPLMKKGWASLTGAGPSQAALDAGATTGAEMLGSMATTAPTVGAGAGTGMMATMGTLAPWLLGGYFGGKALGLFNKGGHVGPLYADEGTMVFPDPELPEGRKHFYDPNKEKYKPKGEKYIPEAGSLKSFDQGYNKDKIQNLYGGGIAGPLSKLQVKSANGETVTMSYGGTVKQGG